MQRALILLLAGLLTLPGCGTMLHNLQPHRLWRWNYHEAPGSASDVLYSVPDRLVPPSPDPVSALQPSAHD